MRDERRRGARSFGALLQGREDRRDLRPVVVARVGFGHCAALQGPKARLRVAPTAAPRAARTAVVSGRFALTSNCTDVAAIASKCSALRSHLAACNTLASGKMAEKEGFPVLQFYAVP